MAGPTSLKVAKALLTRYCNNLQRLTEECEKELKAEFNVWNVQKSQDIQREVMELEANINLVSQSLEKFANVVDSVMDSVTEEQEQQVQKYIDKAQTTIDQAQNLTIQLESARISARDHAGDPTLSTSSSVRGHREAAMSQLPPIPVPTFTGELWDFENFWRLFEANVDHQPLTKLQKFNYLINALQGEARELINRFTVTEDNYEEAVAMLRRKYGDKSRLVAKLQLRLEETHATSTSTAAQRRLLETIIPLVSQLEAHKVYLDGSFAAQKVLSKFSASIQRKILQQCITPEMQEENWHMKDIITALDDCISTEERITEMMTNTGSATNTYTRRTRTTPFRDVNIPTPCLFCNATHRMAACDKLNTTAQRRRFFQESNRCLNCASQGHFVKDCRSPGCRACLGQKHHHTLCPKRSGNEGWAQKPQAQTFGTTRNLQRPLQQEDISPHSKPTARTHLLSAEDFSGEPQIEQVAENEPATVLHATICSEKRPNDVTRTRPRFSRQKKSEKLKTTATFDRPTLSRMKPWRPNSDADLDEHPPVKVLFAKACSKPSMLQNTDPYSNESQINENTCLTTTPPTQKRLLTRADAATSISYLDDDESTLHRIWKCFMDFREDVKRQQQEMRDWIQSMCDHSTLIAKNNTSRPGTIRLRKKREKVEGEAIRAEQQFLQSQRKKVDEERRRISKQSTQQIPRRFLAGLGRNLELTTFAQKEETCEEQRRSIRSTQKKEKMAKHTNKDDILCQEKRKSKMIAEHKEQRMKNNRNQSLPNIERRSIIGVLNKRKKHGLRKPHLAKLHTQDNPIHRYHDNLVTSSYGGGNNGTMPARNETQYRSHPHKRRFRIHMLDDVPISQVPSKSNSAEAGSIADRDAFAQFVRIMRNATRRPLNASIHISFGNWSQMLAREKICHGMPQDELSMADATFLRENDRDWIKTIAAAEGTMAPTSEGLYILSH